MEKFWKDRKRPLDHPKYDKIFFNSAEAFNDLLRNEDTLRKEDSLDDIMLQSLLMERRAFIELLVMNGFVMKNFLTVEKLAKLYNEAADTFKELKFQLGEICNIRTRELNLRHIDKLLQTIMKEHHHQLYQMHTFKRVKTFKELNVQLQEFCDIRTRELNLRHIHKLLQSIIKDHFHPLYQMHTQKTSKNISFMNKTFNQPYFELFLWSIFTAKLNLVEFFWHKIQEPLLGAILAASIYSKLARFYKDSKAVKNFDNLYAFKKKYEDKANQLCEIALKVDVTKGLSILEKMHSRWGGRGLMELSYIGHLRAVIANPSCQMVVNQSWRRGFSKLNLPTCLVGVFFPVVIWTPMVRFQPGLGDDGGDLNWAQKMFVFYKCPKVKYAGMLLSFMLFILLYSYVILFGYRWEYQIPEICLYVWICVIIVGEIRELFKEPSKRMKGKLRDYWSSIWNKFDVVFCLSAIIAFILRQFKVTFWTSRIFMVCNCAIYYVRVFRIYHASRSLGPKLVIFQRMIPEIITFMLLLVVFILAYGVAIQAIIDPYRDFTLEKFGKLFFEVLFLPYWQMYGELSIEDIEVIDSTGCYNETQKICYSSLNTTTNVSSEICVTNGTMDESTAVKCSTIPDWEELNTSKYISQIFLAIYLLFGNVMLLNLLIAIFTSVFEEVHENSNEVWKWEMFRLLTEYDGRPGLAPPLVIFEDVWRISKLTWKHTCRSHRENLETYIKETVEMLKLFEKDCMDTYVALEAKTKENSVDERLGVLEKKTDTLLEIFEDAPDDNANWGEIVDTDKKFYHTSSSSAGASSSDENNPTQKGGSPKKNTLSISANNKATSNNNKTIPPVSRAQSARAARSHHEIQREITELRDRLESVEQKRNNDIDRLENQLIESNKKIENMLQQLLTQQKSKPIKK